MSKIVFCKSCGYPKFSIHCERPICRARHAEAKLAVAVSALEWYRHLGPMMDKGLALWDGGQIARNALAEIKSLAE